jgi:hypothetical protein
MVSATPRCNSTKSGSPTLTPTRKFRRSGLKRISPSREGGASLLLGSIRPDPSDLTAGQLELWLTENPPSENHSFVHGANLGVRADAYRKAGGFSDRDSDEDVGLVGALTALGVHAVSTDLAPVLTSGRLEGRAPDGFARYLRDLLA